MFLDVLGAIMIVRVSFSNDVAVFFFLIFNLYERSFSIKQSVVLRRDLFDTTSFENKLCCRIIVDKVFNERIFRSLKAQPLIFLQKQPPQQQPKYNITQHIFLQ